ncbi:Zinc metalloproteinase nas-19 [Caenorhabditis elegans]|uniref:Zinc metalloproteinase nas-19 n=1 Tax=Caenorhabditis elegans TaxID=6239 RepID=NAS19_CAEEL|nr:Zinc metalloproteinase nas-19 [Caenorhabditis elegans]Q21181.2 RecName: Full=Zinc metalloproteinase nas-19; AltName: Full=Nematode astacin 19; Flags: Precursor [Caenorhabditis elegans]CAA98504.2 Zinc metalloproteinase nas-19 [Caenorhabditis elegans]|eukprot:NP_505893.2 Zinc metalloproteinase nas-19 [Caenorhabditis elegans]
MVRLIHLIGAIILLFSYAYCGLSRLNEHDIEESYSHKRVKRQFERLGTKWSYGVVNYYYADKNNEIKEMVESAIAYIANHTCIRFNEDQNAVQRVQIRMQQNWLCQSTVGAPGMSMSKPIGELSMLVQSCDTIGSIVHEFSHSLGRFHEHTRPDRDNFMKVTTTVHEARPRPSGMTTMYGPFEHGSVMMYHADTYGPGTMDPLDMDYKQTMGNRRVTFYDMYKINQYYGCWCSKQLECKNGGYTSPSDCSRCNCPKGFFGNLCDERQQDSYELMAVNNLWQSITIPFAYKPEPGSDGFYSTFVYITGKANSTIEITLEGLQDVICTAGCTVNGVEIKFKEDSKITSPVVCCTDKPPYKNVFKSSHNPTIIELYSRTTLPSAVTFKYRFTNDKVVLG